jgi:hypothetical protein
MTQIAFGHESGVIIIATPGQSSIMEVKYLVADEKEKQASCPKKGEQGEEYL